MNNWDFLTHFMHAGSIWWDLSPPFACNECDKSFHAKKLLTEHMKVHTKVEPNSKVSDKCLSKDYKNNQIVNKHTNEKRKRPKPFSCEICQKSYDSKYKLNDHMNTHSGLKPYQCPVCQKSFSYNCSLNRHISENCRASILPKKEWP